MKDSNANPLTEKSNKKAAAKPAGAKRASKKRRFPGWLIVLLITSGALTLACAVCLAIGLSGRDEPAVEAADPTVTATPTVKVETEEEPSLEKLAELNDGVVPYMQLHDDGTVKAVAGSFSDVTVTDGESALAALSDASSILGLDQPDVSYEVVSVGSYDSTDYYRVQACYAGYPVYGSQIVLTADEAGKTDSVNNACDIPEEIDLAQNVSVEDAFAGASETCDGVSEEAELLIYPTDETHGELAYRFEGAETVIVSAVSGDVLLAFTNINTWYSGSESASGYTDEDAADRELIDVKARTVSGMYYLFDESRGIAYFDACGYDINDLFSQYSSSGNSFDKLADSIGIISEDDTVFGDKESDSGDRKAVSLYKNLSAVYDYYKNVLGITSYDNRGGYIYAIVNDEFDNGANAFNWGPFDYGADGKATLLSFGYYASNHKRIDVVGHEFTHAIQHSLTDSLSYYGETGALMEAYSDIMGELIQLSVEGATDWQHGKRSLPDPEAYGYPSTYGGNYWKSTTASYDAGNVHTNSTVISHAAYLMYTQNLCTADTFAKLLYNTWAGLGSYNASFTDYAETMVLAAVRMGFSDSKIGIITSAFESVGVDTGNSVPCVKLTFTDEDGQPLRCETVEITRLSYINQNGKEKDLESATERSKSYPLEDSTVDIYALVGTWTFLIEAEGYASCEIEVTVPQGGTSEAVPLIGLAEEWKDAYIAVIDSLEPQLDPLTGERMESYALLDINGDKIPELYVNSHVSASGALIYTYSEEADPDEPLNFIALSADSFGYFAGENLFVDAGGHQGWYYHATYCIEGGYFVPLHYGSYTLDENSRFEGEWDGVSVDIQEYKQELRAAYDASAFDANYGINADGFTGDLYYTYDEISSAIRGFKGF